MKNRTVTFLNGGQQSSKPNKPSNALDAKYHAGFIRLRKQFEDLLNADLNQTEI